MFSLNMHGLSLKRLQDKKGEKVLNGFTEIVNEFNFKPKKLCVDQGREFHNKLMQEWLDNNDVLMLIVKVNIRVRITMYKIIFSKGYTENWSREIFIIDSVFKTNRWT